MKQRGLGLGIGVGLSEPVLGEQHEPEVKTFLTNLGVTNDATIYMPSTAYAISGEDLYLYLNDFVVNTKNILGLALGSNNLSTKFKFIYPRLLNTSSAHRYNLVTGLQDGTYYGGWTFSGGGSKPNGTNGYFNTGYYNNQVVRNDASFGVFIKESFNDLFPEGASGSGNSDILLYPRYSGSTYTRFQNADNYITANGSSIAMWIMSRIAGNEYKVYKNSSLFTTAAEASLASSVTGVPVYEGATASTTAGTAIQFGTSLRTFSFLGNGMSQANAIAFSSEIQALDTLLNR